MSARYFQSALAALIASVLLCASPAAANQLRIVSWNMANIAEGPGIDLRGYTRSGDDYEQLRFIIEKLNPDIVALQELGSAPAAERILGDGYEIQFEARCIKNAKQCREDVDDIYNAIAYRKNLDGVSGTFQIDAIAITHTGSCRGEGPRQVRGGVGVKIELGGTTYWIPSLHLKAGCKTNGDQSSGDQRGACATQREQFEALVDWMDSIPEDDAVILAGDFNRQLLTPSDDIRNDVLLAYDPDMNFSPSGEYRSCWKDFDYRRREMEDEAAEKFPEIEAVGGRPLIFRPLHNRLIDFFIWRNVPETAHAVSVQVPLKLARRRFENPSAYLEKCDGSPKKFDNGQVLTFAQAFPSDHCPLLMLLTDE